MKINYKDATIELDFLDEYYGITVEHPDSKVIYAIQREFGGHLDDYELPTNIRFSSTNRDRLGNYLNTIKICIDFREGSVETQKLGNQTGDFGFENHHCEYFKYEDHILVLNSEDTLTRVNREDIKNWYEL